MTSVTRGDEQILEQVMKQLNKLVNVLKVVDMAEGDYLDREMALIKVSASEENKAEIMRLVEIFRGRIEHG